MTDSPRVLGGRYEVGELIGRGGMAEVHLGHDTRLGRQVAIKMLRADLARDHTFLTRFRREAQSAAGLQHHAIVAVYDSGEDGFTETGGATVNVPYIVMEYVDGKTLREILNEEGRLEPDEASRITMGILSALEYSHHQGIVHRDIKPANVMLTRGGGVKVMDFGIARALADTGATMTSASAVVGTARYLSPEQAQGETVDVRSDLYSTGCVLFELLTGRTPFVGEAVSLVYQHIQDPPPAPSAFEPSVPAQLDAVTLHALQKPRADRYQDAASFRADLQAARTGQPLSAAALATAAAHLQEPDDNARRRPTAAAAVAAPDHTADMSRAEPAPRRTWLWVLAGAVALAAILGIGLTFMNGNDKPAAASSVTVPSVLNLSQTQATALLRENGFSVDAQESANDAPPGQVFGQDPKGAASAPSGSVVTIDVSTGPAAMNMPDLLGKTEQEARAELAKIGFKDANITVAAQQQDNTKYAQGQVASSNPAAGAQVSATQTVTLRLSSGKVVVPSDIQGKSIADAAIQLNDLGLKIKETAVPTANKNKVGKVLDVPQAGDKVNVGSQVELIVGTSGTETQTRTITLPPPSPSSSSAPTTPAPSSTSSSPSSTPKPTLTGGPVTPPPAK